MQNHDLVQYNILSNVHFMYKFQDVFRKCHSNSPGFHGTGCPGNHYFLSDNRQPTFFSMFLYIYNVRQVQMWGNLILYRLPDRATVFFLNECETLQPNVLLIKRATQLYKLWGCNGYLEIALYRGGGNGAIFGWPSPIQLAKRLNDT